jgi:3-hydroxyisobutyrate dehydrogenase
MPSATSSSLPNVTYGFIGIGVMGRGMALNLAKKIPKSSKLVVCELVEARRDSFMAEAGSIAEVAYSPREVAERAVSFPRIYSSSRAWKSQREKANQR